VSRARAAGPWVATAAAIGVLLCAVAWPADTGLLLGAVVCLAAADWAARAGLRLWTRRPDPTNREPAAAVDCAGCAGCGGPDCIQHPEDDDLTADEARALADDLSLQLYRAQDALDFVGELCDIADRQGRQPTTADVRAWLAGPQCARQAGLILTPDASGPNPDTARTDPDATGQAATDQAGHHPDSIRTRPPEGSTP
jgi:hypothetical protein